MIGVSCGTCRHSFDDSLSAEDIDAHCRGCRWHGGELCTIGEGCLRTGAEPCTCGPGSGGCPQAEECFDNWIAEGNDV